jgi:hypothetical protein
MVAGVLMIIAFMVALKLTRQIRNEDEPVAEVAAETAEIK